MKTAYLLIVLLIMLEPIEDEHTHCYAWHFDKKGEMFLIDTLTIKSIIICSYYVVTDYSICYYSFIQPKKIEKPDWDRLEMMG